MLKEFIELPGGHKNHLYYKLDDKGCILNTSNNNDNNTLLSVNNLKDKLIGRLSSILLPIGYPQSVASEYMEYQLYDTIQELCGYLKGIVMNQASLTGLGNVILIN